jgi:hypothetical protein
VLNQHEPLYLEHLSRLLLAGKGPRRMLDVLQIGAAQVLLETQDSLNFSISQHCYEYCNMLGWFYDIFEHPQRLILLDWAASFLDRNACIKSMAAKGAVVHQRRRRAEPMRKAQQLARITAAIIALDGPQAVARTRAYLASDGDLRALVGQLALAACRLGNDPHNQEIARRYLTHPAGARGLHHEPWL